MVDGLASTNSCVARVQEALRSVQDTASARAAVVQGLEALIGTPAASDASSPDLPTSSIPDEGIFCVSGGEPSSPEGRQLQRAQPFWDQWTAKLTGIRAILQDAPAELVQAAVARLSQPAPARPGTVVPGGTLIQELPSTAEIAPPNPATLPVLQLLLISSLYAPAAGLQAAWSSANLAAAAEHLVRQLSLQSAPSKPEQSGQKACPQRLLTAAFQPACKYWRVFLMCQPKTEQERLEPYAGPSSFRRVLAARQLAWWVSQLQYRALEACFGQLLPLILACMDDPSAPVQCLGLCMVRHLAQEAQPATLEWQRDLLLHHAKQAIVGPDASVWPFAAPAACSMALSLSRCGKDGQQALGPILEEMLLQGERFQDDVSRRTVWLASAPALFQALGLTAVRHFRRVMPLLLPWCWAADEATRSLALPALKMLLTQCWPRIPAHAGILEAAFERSKALEEVDGDQTRLQLLAEMRSVVCCSKGVQLSIT